MAGTIVVDRIESDSSYTSTINVASKVNFTGGMQIGGQDATFGGMRNRLINGNMTIDQRYSGANTSVATSGYIVDRWYVQAAAANKITAGRNLNNVTPPPGFTNYFGLQTTVATTPGSSDPWSVFQWIEGYNIANLNLGTANASSFTISFWVYSSLTGTFSGGVGGYNGSSLSSYGFTYSIPVANTWTKIIVTIPGDTRTYAYNTTNGSGLFLMFDLGSGSNYRTTAGTWGTGAPYAYGVTGTVSPISTLNATFYFTGVQLEKGSAATDFEFRHYGQEYALCQRYFSRIFDPAMRGVGTGGTAGGASRMCLFFPQTMRAAPTLTYSGTMSFWDGAVSTTSVSLAGYYQGAYNSIDMDFTIASAFTAGRAVCQYCTGSLTKYVDLTAEL